MEKKAELTKEQKEMVDEMLKESENIGYTKGHDDAIEELINELKSKFYRRI